MLKLDKNAKKYLSCVKCELKPYSFAFKKKALHTLTNDLFNFQEDLPEADFEQICKHFGHPNKFADNLLETIDADELKKGIKKAQITMWVVIVLLVLFIIIGAIRLNRILNSTITHTVETTIVYIEE